MTTDTFKLMAAAVMMVTSSFTMAQNSNAPYQCPNGQCGLNPTGGNQASGAYPAFDQYSQDRYSYPESRYGELHWR